MNHDIGIICPACGCITIFQAGSDTPRQCSRCHDEDPQPAMPPRERPTRPGGRGRRPEAPQLDWME
ncbi:hypothetical protein WMF18_27855 [Sorangium sp. So ce315]|uniref:hypothetical protein n=1 Tax=Sorangium sp. So ce315 TaxID=3133299 RepID=UPI003F629B2B